MAGRILTFLCVLGALCGEAPSAPPAVTYLHPAGGQRGTTVAVTAAGTFERWPVRVWTSDQGITATADKAKGKLSVRIAADAVPGVHWVRLHDDQGASPLRPFIVGTLPEVAEQEPNDEPGKPQTVALPAVVNGQLVKSGDVDGFAVALQKGQTLVAALDAHDSLRSPMDGVLQILSPDGFVLEQNNDWHRLDPRVVFVVPADGTYQVRLFAFPATPDASVRLSGGPAFVYRLTLTTDGFADFPVPLAVERKAGATVAVQGWNIPAEARRLSVAPAGNVATVFHPRLANSVEVRLEGHPCYGPDARGPWAPPFSVTGQLQKPGEARSVTLAGKKAQPLSMRVESQTLGLPVNPVIRVLDGTGTQVARAEPPGINRDTELAFTPPADGNYSLEVRDLYGGGGPRHYFRARVTPPEPDFALTVAADRFAVQPGTPLDIPVTMARQGGFAKDIELGAEGLPAGVSAQVVPPTGKADPKKAVLRLTATKAGPSGSFRIVGRSKALPGVDRTATALLAEFDTTTTALWLAVGGEAPPPPKAKKKR